MTGGGPTPIRRGKEIKDNMRKGGGANHQEAYSSVVICYADQLGYEISLQILMC
jgi:hypothetical protein